MRKKFETAVGQFNGQFYFECHDILEDIWMDAPAAEKPFFQGLLYIAVGLYHFEDENYKGALSQLDKAKKRLEPFLPEYHGVSLEKLIRELESFFILARQKTAGERVHFEKPAFPKIVWNKDAF